MSLSISVITPSYNQGPFIERTIQSVLSQKVPLEYVICDGGSTDDTLSILTNYEDRLTWLSEPDRGQADAVNKGIERSSGDIIGWLNSDDVYYPGALEAVMRCFADSPDVDVIYGQANHIDQYDEVIEPYPTEPWNPDRLRDICFLCQPAVFFQRRIVDTAGLLNPDLQYCMDYEYWIRLARQHQFYYLRQPLAGSRMYPTNKTWGQRVAVHREIISMLDDQIGIVPDAWIFGYAHAVVDSWNGFQRGQRAYAVAFACISCLSFLRWRGIIPQSAVPIIREWITPRFLK